MELSVWVQIPVGTLEVRILLGGIIFLMTLSTHILLGAIIGKLTGNSSLAIISSIAPDIDHFDSYIKSGVIKNRKKFWETVLNKEDPYGDQRGYLHNIFVFLIISIILFFLFGKFTIAIIFGWLGHLLLDSLDNSDYWPLYPNKKINLRGPIKYFSFRELFVFLILLAIYLVL